MVSCVEAWRDLNQTMIDKEYINTDEKSTLDFNKTKDFVENSYSYYKTNDYDYNTNVDNRQMLADNDKNLQNITRCDECFAIVPTNTMKCLVCEKIIHDNYTKEQDNHICVNCGAVNPITVSSCLICEEKILKKRKELYPCKTVKPIDRINCVSCNRTLNISAKYCDWCGIEVNNKNMINSYSRCVPTNTSLNNYNNCNSCNMKTEEKLSLIRSGLNNNLQYQKYNKVDFGTQTVGIIYPFKNPNQKEKSCNVINNNSASKSTYTYLNQISPGKGYWRVQLDHMYAHIKSYATKNANFRDLISEVNLGKIISTTVTEDSTEFTMSATFQYHGTTLVRTMKKKKVLHKFSNLLQDRMPEKKKLSIEDKKCHYEKQFLKSVGNRNSKLDEIQYFIDNGINVDAKNKHGMSALHIAVTTNYHKLVKLLLENGANINILSKPKNNTPLHDSILNGNDGIKIIEILLGFGADARRTNNKKQTPYDIAVNLGLKKIASLLYKHVTNKQIESCIIDKKL